MLSPRHKRKLCTRCRLILALVISPAISFAQPEKAPTKTVSPAADAASTYVNTEYHYRLSLPKGWVPIPEHILAGANAELKRILGATAPTVLVLFWFQPGDLDKYSGPGVSVMHDFAMRGMSLNEILKAQSDFSHFAEISDRHASKAFIDSGKQMVIHAHSEEAQGVRMAGVDAYCPGKEVVVHLGINSRESSYSTLRPAIRRILDGFEFATGYGYEGK